MRKTIRQRGKEGMTKADESKIEMGFWVLTGCFVMEFGMYLV